MGTASARHPLYWTWAGIVRRCTDPRQAKYPLFGGRGVKVDPAWVGPAGFGRFAAAVGPRPSPAHVLVRHPDPAGDFRPGNVRWETWADRNRTRPNARPVTAGGRTMCLREWARAVGVAEGTLAYRVRRWGADRAVSTPHRASGTPARAAVPPAGA